jgi:hypothetical protein
MAATTGTNQDQNFVIQLLKSYKMEFQNAATPVEKQQAAQKADQLRANAKLQGIQLDDAVWGQNVPLASTPGGNTIDWNLLSSMGKQWAATNPIDDVSRWKQQVGTGLTQNLAGYQAQFATATEQGAYGALAGTPATTGSAVGAPVTVPQAVAAAPAAVPAVAQPTASLVPPGYKDSASFQSMLSSLGLGQFAPVKLGRM